MTKRKPPGVSFGSWVDKQVSDAVARGEFDNLPGAGKPIKNLDQPYDEVWVMRNLRRDGFSTEDLLPTPLRLRKEIERLPETVRQLRTERSVRDTVADLNGRIRDWVLLPQGPAVPVAPVDVEKVVERWRAARAAAAAHPGADARVRPATTGADTGDKRPADVPAPRARWWHRLIGRN